MPLVLVAEITLHIRNTALFWAVNATIAIGIGVILVWIALRLAIALEVITSILSAAAREREEEAARTRDMARQEGTNDMPPAAAPVGQGEQETRRSGRDRPFHPEDPAVTEINKIFPYARYDRSLPFD
jgi:hypothetical protein